jgi:hypothetical protein
MYDLVWEEANGKSNWLKCTKFKAPIGVEAPNLKHQIPNKFKIQKQK